MPRGIDGKPLHPLDGAFQPLAQKPGEAEEGDEHQEAHAGGGVVHDLLRHLAESVAGEHHHAGPDPGGDEVEHEERRPGQGRHAVGEAGDAADAVRIAVQQDHPDVVAIGELGRQSSRGGRAESGAASRCRTCARSRSARIAREGTEPAHCYQRAEVERARARRVAGEQAEQQGVAGGVAEHEAVGDIAVLADQLEEGGEVGRENQGRAPFGPGRLRVWKRQQSLLASRADAAKLQAGTRDGKSANFCWLVIASRREKAMAGKKSKQVTKMGKKAPGKRGDAKAGKPRKAVPKSRSGKVAKPKLLSGGNPQIAKGDGDAPVQAYIAAMPGWKRDVGRRLDALIARAVPGVRRR